MWLVLCIQKVNIDAVGVVGGADGREVFEGATGLGPAVAPAHGGRVVDQEDGVEGGQEVVRVVGGGGDGHG